MVFTILIVFFSLIALITLHELGHFLLAKKFGVKVEEFGIFLPPRLWGKRIGETLYSINALPLGAFVKLYGEEGSEPGPNSFTAKPVWQRMLIIAGGVLSFWAIAIVILAFVFAHGTNQVISDDDNNPAARVEIAGVSTHSPAQDAGLQAGDVIKGIELANASSQPEPIATTQQVQDFTNSHKGVELIFQIQRGNESLQKTLVPRTNPPAGEGAVGIILLRTAWASYSWPQAIGNSFIATWNMTIGVFEGLGKVNWGEVIIRLFKNVFKNEGNSTGTQLMGPIGMVQIMVAQTKLGLSYYLQFVAMLSVYLAVFNVLPIPALDGGKLLFLALEAVRRKPVPPKIEQPITAVFFFLLIALIILVSIGDIRRLF